MTCKLERHGNRLTTKMVDEQLRESERRVRHYMIDCSRGSPTLQELFTEEFEGVLITDSWSAHESVCADDRQYCLVHLLRELAKVDEHNDCAEWQAFAKKSRRLLRDGIRLRKRADFVPGKFASKLQLLDKRSAARLY